MRHNYLALAFVLIIGGACLQAETSFADAVYPSLSGTYISSAQHPGVFTTQADLKNLVTRINAPGSFSAQMFNRLLSQVKTDLATDMDWDATYSGCKIQTYLYAFSYESQDSAEAAKAQAELQLSPSTKPPAGAAIVASRLALYAALVKTGAKVPVDAPTPSRAIELAKRILLAWGNRGFSDGKGHFLSSVHQFCEDNGKVDPGSMTQVGLQIARGVIYSVQAQDLLMYLGAFGKEETERLNAFHSAMFTLIQDALNYNFTGHNGWDCDHYSNHAANQLAGLLATARLLDDERRFDAVLYGRMTSIEVTLPWANYFSHAVYGENDSPNQCYPNTGSNGLTSRPFFQTKITAPGEIDDRYRNDVPIKSVGYSMFTLERLFDAAEILRNAGYDPYAYRGVHGQSIGAAIRYYACYAKGAGFGKMITSGNSGSCPDFAQYDGKTASGIDRNILIGAYRFPNDTTITELDAAAKVSAGLPVDALLFGHWKN